MHNRFYGHNEKKIFLFLGQSVRLDNKQVLPQRILEDSHASNLVVSARVVPIKWLDIRSRLLVNRKNGNIESAESSAVLNLPVATLSTSHTYFSKDLSLSGSKTSQILLSAATPKFYDWVLKYSENRNLARVNGIGLLSRSVSASHHNDCLITTITLVKTAFQDRDLRPDTRIFLQLDFKNLGTFTPINKTNIGGTN